MRFFKKNSMYEIYFTDLLIQLFENNVYKNKIYYFNKYNDCIKFHTNKHKTQLYHFFYTHHNIIME